MPLETNDLEQLTTSAGTDRGGSRRPALAWFVPNATVFLSSCCVMVLELVAGRVVSRHLGVSLYTWTSVIGVILAGLAVGNYLGGRLADRYAARQVLSLLFVLSSTTCVVISVANNLVGRWPALWDLAWPARVASHVALVFFLPAALLGTIGPVVAKMALGLGRKTGRTLGSVYAWGVVGSIVGTFATGYVLITFMGTDAIIWSVAAVLGVTGILYVPGSLRSWGWAAALVICFVLAHGSWTWARVAGEKLALREEPDPSVIYADESRYSHVEVREDLAAPGLRGLYLDKLLHSQISIDDPTRLHYGYVRIFAGITLRAAGDKTDLRGLTIGGGGYVFSRFLETRWPDASIEVVEIDPAVTRAAFAAFSLPRDTKIRSHHTDGRVFVNRLVEHRQRGESVPQYDFIYLDAVNDYSVPYQLTTVQFFENVRELLADDGVMLVNFIDVVDSGLLLGALTRTVSEVFPNVAVFTLENFDRLASGSRVTFVVAASAAPLEWPAELEERLELRPLPRLDDDRLNEYILAAGDLVLTDSFAPVEHLMSPVVLSSSRTLAANESLKRAIESSEQGDVQSFIDYCAEAVRLDPDFAEGHYNLGVGLYGRGRQREALTHWRKAVRLRPDYAEAHHNLGAALFADGDLPGALRHLAEAVRVQPRLAAAHRGLSVALDAAGRTDEARRHLEEALRLDPARFDARRDLERSGRRETVLDGQDGDSPGS
jgi:spermidine synthase